MVARWPQDVTTAARECGPKEVSIRFECAPLGYEIYGSNRGCLCLMIFLNLHPVCPALSFVALDTGKTQRPNFCTKVEQSW